MADTEGFEPSRPFRAYSLSRGAPSTTRPRVHAGVDTHEPSEIQEQAATVAVETENTLCRN